MIGVTGVLRVGKEKTINLSPPFFSVKWKEFCVSVFLITPRNAMNNYLGFVLLINFKITTIVGILKCISRINTAFCWQSI